MVPPPPAAHVAIALRIADALLLSLARDSVALLTRPEMVKLSLPIVGRGGSALAVLIENSGVKMVTLGMNRVPPIAPRRNSREGLFEGFFINKRRYSYNTTGGGIFPGLRAILHTAPFLAREVRTNRGRLK